MANTHYINGDLIDDAHPLPISAPAIGVLTELGDQSLTVSTAAVPLTIPTGTVGASIMCGPVGAAATNYVRWRANGSAPTSTAGTPLQVGDYLEFIDLTGQVSYAPLLAALRFIRASTAVADATLEVTYFGFA